jgi:hypothetical protein
MAGWYDRIAGGLLGQPQSYGGLLSAEDQKAAQRQAMMAMGSQLMSSGGWSPQKTTFGQALGPALMAGQQAQGAAGQDMLQAMLLKTKLQKPAGEKPSTVAEYEYAKANGYQGSFEEWKRVASAQPQSPAGIQEYEYFSKLTPDQQKQFLSLQRSPITDRLAIVNGVPTWTNPITHEQTPLSTQESEIQAESRKQFESALAKARGTAQGELHGSIQKKGQNASVVDGMVALADPLIEVATGSTTGAAADKVAGFFGVALDGAKATSQLRVLQAALMTNMPRMEGPQSDADVLLYRQAAGEIGDPTVPREQKKASLRIIRALQGRYAQQASALPAAGLDAPQSPATPTARPPLSDFQK